jgi:hypothetical protein
MALQPLASGRFSKPPQAQQLECVFLSAARCASLFEVLADTVARRLVDVIAAVERLRGEAREKLVVVALRDAEKQPRWICHLSAAVRPDDGRGLPPNVAPD